MKMMTFRTTVCYGVLCLASGLLQTVDGARVALPPRQVASSSSTSATLATTSFTTSTGSVPTTTTPAASTAVPSPTASLNDTLPSQAVLAPPQAWCPSEIFCNGPLLQTINVAELFPDSKTFVDKPTTFAPNATLADFFALYGNASAGNLTNNYSAVTYGSLVDFVERDFKGEGLELQPLLIAQNNTPALLSNTSVVIQDPLVRGWISIVNSYWALLVRTTNGSSLCDGVACQSSLIPLNHTFVVPGGRFREQYYWDSYWIVEGLIQSELYDLANGTLQNFMDELETIGFIPNGGRIYYLNRSQPPLFMKMLWAYVNATSDTSILERALPLAEVELNWWHTNRTVNVTSPWTSRTYELARYAVNNTAPRPEGFLPDYETANGPGANFTELEKQELYSELASGAESGLDYSARWARNPYAGYNASNASSPDVNALLRTLNVKNTIPIDLNSILYKYRVLLADLYDMAGGNNNTGSSPPTNGSMPTNGTVPGNSTFFQQRAAYHRQTASTIRSAILDIHWSNATLAFYDYNLTSSQRNADVLSPASFYPYWSGIIPDELLAGNGTVAERAVGGAVRLVLSKYNGTFPSSFFSGTGLQWDFPNAWPPHTFIVLEALRNLPANITSSPLISLSANGTATNSSSSSFSLLPPGQLGPYFTNETSLPQQPLEAGGFASGDLHTIESRSGEGWSRTLQRELAQRYISSALCSWYATGGSVPGLLPPLASNSSANITDQGHMFEKFSTLDLDNAGSGGEYQVVIGFGWTNGVALWTAKQYGDVLVAPQCPQQFPASTGNSTALLSSYGAPPRLVKKHERMEILKARLGLD